METKFLPMNTKLTNAEKIRRLPWIIAHDTASAVFCQLTVFGTVFILFLNELGLSKTRIGFLLSLFPFCGLISLFIAPMVARVGFKRIFLIFWGLRKFVISFLLLTPWILSRFGVHTTSLYLAGILLIFAICRAIAETSFYPWFQEIIPDSIRGKFSAINNISVTLVSCLTVTVASYVIGRSVGLSRFMILIAIGVVFGLISVWCAFFIPGGAPICNSSAKGTHFKQMINVLQDRNFLHYLGGIGVVSLVLSGVLFFIPLFMKDVVGLSSSNVVLLQVGTLLGGILSGYLWGWAADRYGSKPVMLSGLYIMLLLPICWLLMPRHSIWSNPVAMSIAFLSGLASIGWLIGSNRLLYVSVVPPKKKTEYMAIYYAWIGLVGGCGLLLGGRFLDYSKRISGKFFIFTLDPYTPIFLVSLALLVLGMLLLRQMRAERSTVTGKFIGMFLRGNPFIALESLVRYGMVKEERMRISITERLGEAKSPLTVDELLQTLSDPSFNIRYEALISIARTRRDDRLTDRLIQLLKDKKPLSIIAAWSLGRIGDKRAIEPLREILISGYPLLQAYSARSLATLGDIRSIPLLLNRFRNEPDEGLRVSYASALGALRSTDATGELLTFLATMQDKDGQMELAFALARIVGNEHYFIQLWRRIHPEIGTVTSQSIISLKRMAEKLHMDKGNFTTLADDCAEALAKNDLVHGTVLLRKVINSLPLEKFGETFRIILSDCAEHLNELAATRVEYIVLSLHTINAVLKSFRTKG